MTENRPFLGMSPIIQSGVRESFPDATEPASSVGSLGRHLPVMSCRLGTEAPRLKRIARNGSDSMTTKQSDILKLYSEVYEKDKHASFSLKEYLQAASKDANLYASAAERMVQAIGEPEFVDTSRDPRLGRIFMNRTIKTYQAFQDFYGLEETIERIVGFFRHAAQGLEERKQILYLLGPVGGGKSSLADALEIDAKSPRLRAAAGDEISPIYESPLGLFNPDSMGMLLEEEYGIPRRRLAGLHVALGNQTVG